MAEASLRIVLVDESVPGSGTGSPNTAPQGGQGPPAAPAGGPSRLHTPTTTEAASDFARTLAGQAGFSRWFVNARSIANTIGQFQTLTSSVSGAGAAGAGVAAGGAVTASVVGGLATAAGPAVVALGAVAAGAVAAGVALKAFSALVQAQAKAMEPYSAAVSMATSESELRREQAMFRRADKIGPDVAKWERLRGEAEERLADIATEILDVLFRALEPLEPIAREMVEILKLLPPTIENIALTLETIKDVATLHWLDLPEDIKGVAAAQAKMAKALRDYIDRDKEDEDVGDKLLEDFFRIGEERRRRDAGEGRR